MMKILALCALVAFAYSTPLTRNKRAVMTMAGGYPYGAAAYAGAGSGFGYWPFYNPFDYSRGFMPMFPPMVFPVPMKQWYEGDNVCTTTKSMDDSKDVSDWLSEVQSPNIDNSHQSEQCQGTNTKTVCFKRVVKNGESKMEATKYECCHGFVRNPNGIGCVEIDLRDLLPTLRNMGALVMTNMIEEAGMKNILHSGNFTVFCPQNSGMESYLEEQQISTENEIMQRFDFQSLERKEDLKNLIKSHMVKGFFKLDDFYDGQIIQTENGDARINIYYIPEKVVTVNCVPMITADYFARNGIVHLVEKVLPIPSKTVADIIAGDSQFSVLKGMLSRAGLVQTLRNPNKTFTVFAPTDSTFENSLIEREDRCISSLLKHHIIDHVICSQAIPQFAKSLNMIGELLSLSRDAHNKLYVDDVQIVVKDMIATNGVLHIIDGLLSTRQAQTMSQVMTEHGLSEFLKLIEMANLKSYFDSLKNVTFFVPSDDSLKSLSASHLESFMYDIEALREVLLYHVGIGQPEINVIEQDMNSRLENTSIRIQVHASYLQSVPMVFVQCATVLSSGNKICGGSLHVVNKVLLPPKLSLMELLENIEGFSTLVLLLRVTGMESRLRDPMSRHTLLAPTDDAFHQMGQEALFRLLEDLTFATDLIKMHILPGTVCCSQLDLDVKNGRRSVRAIDGSSLRLGRMTVEEAHLVDCDIMATNGAVHMVDSVFFTNDGVFIRI